MSQLAGLRRDDSGTITAIVAIICSSILTFVLARAFNLFEAVYSLAQQLHAWYICELLIVGAVNSLILSALLLIRGVHLRREVGRRHRAETELQEANGRLALWVQELEQHNQEMAVLNQMGELMQSSISQDELFRAAARSVQQLFPDASGSLLLLSPSRDLLEPIFTWGNTPLADYGVAVEECLALRMGRVLVDRPAIDPICGHMSRPLPPLRICVPLVAQGDILGVMHLRPSGVAQGTDLPTSRQQLVATVSRQIALSLANLRLRHTLRDQAIRDPGTLLYNRRYMDETLEREVRRAQRRTSPLVVMMLDVDHFKRFNDHFGHEAGDALLQALGSYLQTSVRGEDIACRYGGEEFALILPDTSLAVAEHRAEELRRGVKGLAIQHQGQPLGEVTVSIGVASMPEHGDDGVDLLRAADAALYQAKADGRDRVVLASLRPDAPGVELPYGGVSVGA